jgi:hypothetical protein
MNYAKTSSPPQQNKTILMNYAKTSSTE